VRAVPAFTTFQGTFVWPTFAAVLRTKEFLVLVAVYNEHQGNKQRQPKQIRKTEMKKPPWPKNASRNKNAN